MLEYDRIDISEGIDIIKQKNYREAKKHVSQKQIFSKSALQNCYCKDIFCSFFY